AAAISVRMRHRDVLSAIRRSRPMRRLPTSKRTRPARPKVGDGSAIGSASIASSSMAAGWTTPGGPNSCRRMADQLRAVSIGGTMVAELYAAVGAEGDQRIGLQAAFAR